MGMETHVGHGGGDAASTTQALSPRPPVEGVCEKASSSRLPKKPLLSCAIEAHTIQKCPSPKKKALDPLRYMPERASFHALFSVVARFEDHSEEYHVLRSYAQFRTLHVQLQRKFPKSNLPKDLPSVRKKRFENDYVEQKASELGAYLAQLISHCEVRQSKILRDFLEECPQSEASDDDDAVPTKMLDGLPGTIVSVRAGQSFTVSLRLQTAGDIASWQFTTKKHNIGFSATFNGNNVRVYSREDSQLKPVKGSFKCSEAGTLTLDWDNTYTWSKTKVLVYWAEVEQSRTQTFGNEATGAGAVEAGVPVADATSLVDGRRAGYIAQSRNPSLYPRQIVNTSLSLIAKPFTRTRQSQAAQCKAGSLIVERNVKFRGRNWYRKWFVLDTRKCVLRYYDSEQASRKGLSLAKINLATKNACLAITSQDEASPTPYMFMVRARKRCWKMCASSQVEYNEWEHAISTAILTAQLKRRKKRAESAPLAEKNDANDADVLEDDESDDDDDDDDDDDEDEEPGKEDDAETEEDENDSDPSGARDSTVTLEPRSSLAVETAIVTPVDTDHHKQVENNEAKMMEPVFHRIPPVSTRLSECWLGDLRGLSSAKKILALIGLNWIVHALRSSSLPMAIVAVVVVNAFALVHALEAPSAPRPGKDKQV